MTIESIINGVVLREGGYTNNPDDAGGETNFGITIGTAHRYGYTGNMRDMSKEQAFQMYMAIFVTEPKFDKVYLLSPPIAEELIDTGVNMGAQVAAEFLQIVLNAFNDQEKYWPDLKVDGGIGDKTINTLAAFLKMRKGSGESVMLKAINCLQGARYISLSQSRPKDEDFVYGWIDNRISIPSFTH